MLNSTGPTSEHSEEHDEAKSLYSTLQSKVRRITRITTIILNDFDDFKYRKDAEILFFQDFLTRNTGKTKIVGEWVRF